MALGLLAGEKMSSSDDARRAKAISILDKLGAGRGDGTLNGRHGFSIDRTDDGFLLSRWGHAIGLIRRSGHLLQFLRIGNSLPSIETPEADELIDHLADVVAGLLSPTNNDDRSGT